MRRAVITIGAISIGASFISFILMFFPGFVSFVSKSTTYLGGSSSTSKGSAVAGTLPDAGIFLVVICSLLIFSSIIVSIMTIRAAVQDMNPKVFVGIDVFCKVASIFTVAFLMPLAGGKSSTSGVSGAWSSSSVSCSVGGVGVFFIILQVIMIITSIVIIVKMNQIENR